MYHHDSVSYTKSIRLLYIHVLSYYSCCVCKYVYTARVCSFVYTCIIMIVYYIQYGCMYLHYHVQMYIHTCIYIQQYYHVHLVYVCTLSCTHFIFRIAAPPPHTHLHHLHIPTSTTSKYPPPPPPHTHINHTMLYQHHDCMSTMSESCLLCMSHVSYV
jgi:hypothetical protein